MKVPEANIAHLDDVNQTYWKYDYEKNELEGLGYYCLRCGACRMVKPPEIDEETAMYALD